MKDLKIITVVPGNLYFASEVEILINNLRKFDYSYNLQVLVDTDAMNPKFRIYWSKLGNEYREVDFYYYSSYGARNLKMIYSPVIRPNILKQHFKKYPSLTNSVILYVDSDIVFTKKLDFTPYLYDNINYLSKTDYISANYFDSKIKDVLPNRLKQFSNKDVLNDCCKIVGIDRRIAELNQGSTGGCQYILKNIDYKFWEKVEQDCVTLRIHLQSVNNLYFSSERAGYQSWTADMLAVLWNLWLINPNSTLCPPELDFSWATQKIEEWDKYYIYHNAGVTDKYQQLNGETVKMYNKSEVVFKENVLTPFDVKYEGIDPRYCDFNYLQEILSIKNPVCKSTGYVY